MLTAFKVNMTCTSNTDSESVNNNKVNLLEAFITDLQTMASMCDFTQDGKDYSDQMIWGWLVCGMRSEGVRQRLLAKDKLAAQIHTSWLVHSRNIMLHHHYFKTSIDHHKCMCMRFVTISTGDGNTQPMVFSVEKQEEIHSHAAYMDEGKHVDTLHHSQFNLQGVQGHCSWSGEPCRSSDTEVSLCNFAYPQSAGEISGLTSERHSMCCIWKVYICCVIVRSYQQGDHYDVALVCKPAIKIIKRTHSCEVYLESRKRLQLPNWAVLQVYGSPDIRLNYIQVNQVCKTYQLHWHPMCSWKVLRGLRCVQCGTWTSGR